MEFINLKAQYQLYKESIDAAMLSVVESGHFIMSETVGELEAQLSHYAGTKHCIGVSSGSDAILLALKAANIGPGDEVICVPFTWISPIECVASLGAKPVFVDIDPNTFLMDLDALEGLITDKTKAIIPVSLYGQMPDFDKLMSIAERHNLVVIEDGAQSFGSTQNGKKSCSIAHISTTSFFPTKPLGCYGDGGAIFTNDSLVADKIRALRVHGANKRYNHIYVGQNARLDSLQAAILMAKLPHLNQELHQRNYIGNYFNTHLKDCYITPEVIEGNFHVFAQYVLRHTERDQIIEHLKHHQIPSAIYYPICIHMQPAYQYLGYKQGDFPHAETVCEEVFSIPMHPFLKEEEMNMIISALKEAVMEKAI